MICFKVFPAARFSKADEALGVKESSEKPVESKSFSRVVRKTFSVPETELELIDKIKDKARRSRPYFRICRKAATGINYRVCVLGHIQRCFRKSNLSHSKVQKLIN